ncbi:hypothetical protein SNE40_011513 [Patella caerulea]|uniref:GH10 domain-containing protein n=1 Tax=Patella caerulea TaxID=87958 RepID=A0AAN8JJ85_PATCE
MARYRTATLFLLIVESVLCLTIAQNILKDGDFENSNYPSNNWHCSGNCKIAATKSDKVSGSQSVKITGRTQFWEGPSQQVPMERNTRYHLVFFVKQLNRVAGKVLQLFKVNAGFHINGANTMYPDLVNDGNVHQGRGWVKLEAYIQTPDVSFVKSTIVIQGGDAGIEYLVDNGRIEKVNEDNMWKAEANKRIDQIRKNNINFRVTVPFNTDPHDYSIQIKLNKHAFPFGSMINTDHVLEDKYARHRSLYYYMFNWATLANYYWKWSSGPWDHPEYTTNQAAINELKKRGVPVRGHNIFWGNGKYLPEEVMKLSTTELKHAVDERIRYVVGATKGYVEHWDVNNEMLHNHYFEEKTGDPYYSHHMFSYLHQLDPKVKLFLNDFSVIANGQYASAYVSQASEYRKANVGVYGIGVQCHFPENHPPDPTLIKKRLDQLSTSGYPVWVTELDVVVADENTRAQWYDNALRVLFSHPTVEGIILWDFYGPEHWRGKNAGLVSDQDYRVNPAGKHYIDLIYKEWSTHVIHDLKNGKIFSVRGFHGDYEVMVKYKGTPIKDIQFTLGKSDKTVDITVTDINAHPHIATTSAPNLNLNGNGQNHKIIQTGHFSLGKVTSDDSSFTCKTVWSGFAAVGDDKYAEVSCPHGYVMTGCTSESKSPSDKKDGETIENHGKTCRAWDGSGSTTPVQAAVHCCKKTGLTCNYYQSHPSPLALNARVETPCPQHMYATGCSAHNFFHDMAGAYPTTTSCIAQNHGYTKGIDSFAICCSAPNLHCITEKSRPSGLGVGDEAKLGCPSGYTMTGCHGFSEDGGLSATFIYKNECSTKNGVQKSKGMDGVTAYATCCK